MTPTPGNPVAEGDVARLQRRLERERGARLEAEAIAEKGLRSLYERQQEILLLEEIAVLANEATSVDEALQLAVDRMCHYTTWPVGHAYLCGTDAAAELVPSRIWHLKHPDRYAMFRKATDGTRLVSGTGLPGRVVASGRPAWIADVTTDPNFPRGAVAQEVGLRAGIAFPVLAGSKVAAVLEFFSEASLDPDEALLRVMAHVGAQLGCVVERAESEERLLHDAFHDPLTKLPNRALFMDRLQRAVSRSKRHREYWFAVLFIDLDRFKIVNDSFGHQTGDGLLIEVAERLIRSLRRDDLISRTHASDREPIAADDTLARFAGDEFTILLDDLKDPSDGMRVAERIQEALAVPVTLAGREIFITASIGVASSGPGYQTAEVILRDADTAMYRAKALGGACCVAFDRSMHDRALERLLLESDLRRAIDRQEFRLHYQAIVSLPSRRVVGFEALLRWQRPAHGLVQPQEFVKVAEDTGMVSSIDRWVMREACAEARRWEEQFPDHPPLSVSVNVSAQQFGHQTFVEYVEEVLRETGLRPRSLRLEITESVAMADADRASRILNQLKASGVRISLDDFGTGYSSLSYLRRFPVDTLKIDRSFVAQMNRDQENREIVRAIMNLAHTLGLDVVAEGTETAEQVSDLEALDCQYAQGYFFSRPIALDAPTLQALLGAGAETKAALR